MTPTPHEAANALWQHAQDNGTSTRTAFAAQVGDHLPTVSAVLSGGRVATWDRVHAWAAALGATLTVGPGGVRVEGARDGVDLSAARACSAEIERDRDDRLGFERLSPKVRYTVGRHLRDALAEVDRLEALIYGGVRVEGP